MRPKSLAETGSQGDLFRAHLDQVLNREHPLCVLANQMDWSIFEQEFAPLYVDGFGRPGLPIRLVVGFHYLKYAYNESNESVVERFLENPYWQYFCGFEYFQHEFPLDPSSLVRWRRRVGSKGMEKLLKETVETARRERLMKARQVKRAKRKTKKLRVYLGRVLRDLQRKCPKPGEVLQHLFSIANRILDQQKTDHHKVYSIHAPEVECISKGKVHKRYEFGCKVGLVTTSKENWVVGVGAIHGNPYDGHTLEQSTEQTERVTGWRPSDAYCDRGYRGVKAEIGETKVHISEASVADEILVVPTCALLPEEKDWAVNSYSEE